MTNKQLLKLLDKLIKEIEKKASWLEGHQEITLEDRLKLRRLLGELKKQRLGIDKKK